MSTCVSFRSFPRFLPRSWCHQCCLQPQLPPAGTASSRPGPCHHLECLFCVFASSSVGDHQAGKGRESLGRSLGCAGSWPRLLPCLPLAGREEPPAPPHTGPKAVRGPRQPRGLLAVHIFARSGGHPVSGDGRGWGWGALPVSALTASPFLHPAVTSWSSETLQVTCPCGTTA